MILRLLTKMPDKIKLAQRIIFWSNAFLSFLDGLKPEILISYYIIHGDLFLHTISLRIYIKDLYDLANEILMHLESFLNIQIHCQNNSFLDRISFVERKLGVSRKFDTTKVLDIKNEKLLKKWEDELYIFFECCELFLEFPNKLYLTDQQRKQCDKVLLSAYQEFYHAFSHIFLTTSGFKLAVPKSISHLQRGSIDLVKKMADCISKHKKNDCKDFLECRSDEIFNVSSGQKDRIIRCYLNEVNRFFAGSDKL